MFKSGNWKLQTFSSRSVVSIRLALVPRIELVQQRIDLLCIALRDFQNFWQQKRFRNLQNRNLLACAK